MLRAGAIVTCLVAMLAVTAEAQTVTVNIKTLWCGDTTEHGEDEVFVVVAGTDASGNEVTHVVPDEHWDMNDSGSKQNIGGKTLYTGSLPANQTVSLRLFFMERDGGSPETAMGVAGAAACMYFGGDPSACVAGAKTVTDLLRSFIPKDTDDYIGEIRVAITNTGNGPAVRWIPGDRCEDRGPIGSEHEFWMRGDDSYYRAYMTVGLQ